MGPEAPHLCWAWVGEHCIFLHIFHDKTQDWISFS